MGNSLSLHRKLQKVAGQLVSAQKLGMTATLRNVTGDRNCSVVISEFSAIERQARAAQNLDPLTVKAFIAGLYQNQPVIAPNSEADRLITFVPGTNPPQPNVSYRIVERVAPVAPAGVIHGWNVVLKQL